MYLKSLELSGFKSFAKKSDLLFTSSIAAIVGPNGSGKSNVAEAFRFVLGEQSIKSLRGKKGEDLIFNGSQSTGRGNRAMVKVVFDNTKKIFNIDFDEVSVERTVYRDGVNEYSINGSKVRLRDVIELLAQANIGSSGHHIISQGEADRILSASSKERREMIEDALGLKVYKYKLEESTRKLEKTKENITQVELLRKEIAPHLKFLTKQVEKIEKALALREELKVLYRDYLAREDVYIKHEKKNIAEEKKEPEKELQHLSNQLEKARKTLADVGAGDERSAEVLSLEGEMSRVRREKENVSRTLGRLEGEISFEKRRQEEGHPAESVPLKDIERLVGDLRREAEGGSSGDIGVLRSLIGKIVSMVEDFVSSRGIKKEHHTGKSLADLEREHKEAELKLGHLSNEEEKFSKRYADLRKEIESLKNESREAERAVFSITSEQSELRAKIAQISVREDALRHVIGEFERELQEGAALVGREVLLYEKETSALSEGAVMAESRIKQEERRRTIERIKIRLEESGAGSSDEVMKEYKEVKERSEFLEREVGDLERSAESLKNLIEELSVELRKEFSGGIAKINKEFQEFFSLMFGGGTAALQVIEAKSPQRGDRPTDLQDEDLSREEVKVEEGIEIQISLPRKKIKSLMVLSGGERALTSIALLFAMSQVNPPPFLILDETDAALDEANSKRYGDMIENLSKYSQLILITHNRETMGRAGILYGVTMGSDGISKLLSVRFEEAVAVAK